jgi:hypothetical protein
MAAGRMPTWSAFDAALARLPGIARATTGTLQARQQATVEKVLAAVQACDPLFGPILAAHPTVQAGVTSLASVHLGLTATADTIVNPPAVPKPPPPKPSVA